MKHDFFIIIKPKTCLILALTLLAPTFVSTLASTGTQESKTDINCIMKSFYRLLPLVGSVFCLPAHDALEARATGTLEQWLATESPVALQGKTSLPDSLALGIARHADHI